MTEEQDQRVRGATFLHATVQRDRVPAARYYDPDFFALEVERLWSRVWQMACRLEEIPEVGDFVEYDLLGRSVIVVRIASGSAPGAIAAYHNTCRHRGMQLVKGRGHSPQGLTCPFHGWCWSIDGEIKHVVAENIFDERLLKPEDLKLKTCRLECWGGCAFINFDDTAPPLRPSLEPFATYHDPIGVDRMRAESWYSTVLPVNWKLAAEAFMEGYHTEQTHPQLLARATKEGYGGGTDTVGFTDPSDVVGSSLYFMNVLSKGMGGGMIHPRDIAVAESLRDEPLPEDPTEAISAWNVRLGDEITRRARADGIDMPDQNELVATGHLSSVNFCFPHYFLLPVYGNAAAYRIRPLGPQETRFEIWTTTLLPDDTTFESPREPIELAHDDPAWPNVVRQDFANLPRQQAGVNSPAFGAMRLSKEVEGMISNFHRVIDGYLAGRDHADLLPAIQQVSGGIDAPIREIDL